MTEIYFNIRMKPILTEGNNDGVILHIFLGYF